MSYLRIKNKDFSMERSDDWMEEAKGDLEHAKSDMEHGFYFIIENNHLNRTQVC